VIATPTTQKITTTGNSKEFYRLIKHPTCVSKESSSTTDIILTNKDNIKAAKVIPSTLSDHDMINRRKINHKRFPAKTICCRNFSKYDPVSLNRDLENADWESVCCASNVSQCTAAFTSILRLAFNKHALAIDKKNLKQKAMPLKDLIWGVTTKRITCTEKTFKFKYVSVLIIQKQLNQLKRLKAR